MESSYLYIYIYPEFPVAKSNGKILGTQKKNILIPLKKSMTYDITICVDVSAYFSTARWAVAISDLWLPMAAAAFIAVIRIRSALRWWPNRLQVDDSRLPWCNVQNPWCVSFGAGELIGILIYDEVGCKLSALIYDVYICLSCYW